MSGHAEHSYDDPTAPPRLCQNCTAPLRGPYCTHCGQHDVDYHRSFWHLTHDLLENLFHFEGKFFTSVAWLLAKPGHLTNEFNAGRRFQTELEHRVPTLLFLGMPLFALLLKIFYWRTRRYYIEHLIFSIHLHTWVFLAIVVSFGYFALASLGPYLAHADRRVAFCPLVHWLRAGGVSHRLSSVVARHRHKNRASRGRLCFRALVGRARSYRLHRMEVGRSVVQVYAQSPLSRFGAGCTI